jgi:DNA-binding CsgD family transcriptional regulator
VTEKLSDEQVEALLEVQRAASVGATFQERMASVSARVLRLVPDARVCASVHDPDAPEKLAADPQWYFGTAVGIVRPYAERYLEQDPLRAVYAEATGLPALLSDTEVGRRYGADPFTAEFLAALGIRHVLLLAHRMPDGSVFVFAMHRGPERPDFDERERALVARCSRDLARAAVGPVLRRVLLNHLPTPARTVHALAFDAEARAIHTDLGAAPLLEAPGLLERLTADLKTVLATRPAPGIIVERDLPGATGSQSVRLVTLDQRSGLGALVILFHEAADSRFERLVREARLTARERQVATLAIEGLRNRDIADRLGVGVDTVKWHLKTIFQKTKVRGRGGLAAIVLGRQA